jgi:hypothetical protein
VKTECKFEGPPLENKSPATSGFVAGQIEMIASGDEDRDGNYRSPRVGAMPNSEVSHV